MCDRRIVERLMEEEGLPPREAAHKTMDEYPARSDRARVGASAASSYRPRSFRVYPASYRSSRYESCQRRPFGFRVAYALTSQ